ncbi:MAG: isoprenylcysteine carboxylmethyltransferase family protein [Thermoplasmata archaeon]
MRFVRRAEKIFWAFVAFIAAMTATVMILDRGHVWPLVHFEDWMIYPGIAVMACGYSLRKYAIWTLGRAFSNILCIKEGQRLTCSGIYAKVRHPAYTGTLIAVAGIPFLFSSPVGLIPISLAIPAVLYRISVEEKMLTEKFGQKYADYAKRTKMLVPYLI